MQDHTKATTLNVLDTVALMKDTPDGQLTKGQVGTIVEELADEVYEVEFANKKGETILTLALSSDYLILLHFEVEAAT